MRFVQTKTSPFLAVFLVALTAAATSWAADGVEGFSMASSSSSRSSSSSAFTSSRSVLPPFSITGIRRHKQQQQFIASPQPSTSRVILTMSKSQHRLSSNNNNESNHRKSPPHHHEQNSSIRVFLQTLLRRVSSRFAHLQIKLKRSFLMVCAAFVLCFGALGGVASESHASSAPPATATATSSSSSLPPVVKLVARTSSNILSPSIDEIVDNYVKDHMFDDDVYDPVESIYREGIDDMLHGTYPKALKEISSSVLGQDVIKAEKSASGSSVGSALVKAVGFLRRRAGLSEMQAIFLLAGSLVVGTPTVAFAVLMMVGTQNKRSINRLMKKRYGETYTVDATIKEDDGVEAPDDDDDEDDDDDDDEDDK